MIGDDHAGHATDDLGMPDIFGLRFIVVAGKGGVGRTTISAALALSAARRGKRVLIAMCNSKERLSYLLEVSPIGPNIQSILPNIEAVNMEPKTALEEYGMMILKVRALYRFIFENRFVAAVMRGAPGLDAWAMLGKAQYHVREKDARNRSRFDLVILDAPATGHGLDMLRIPRVIMEAAPPGLLRREAEAAWELFSDPRQTGICLVSLAEELPVNETLDLHRALTKDLKLPIHCLVINQVLIKLFSDSERAELEKLSPNNIENPYLQSLFKTSRFRARREALQQCYIQRLVDALDIDTYLLPALATPDFRRQAVEQLSSVIDTIAATATRSAGTGR
jgi:anion-transporting  ArsA/GET3 family ATPase